MSDTASDARDRAIADFFKVATELLRLCIPLVKDAIKAQMALKTRH